MKTSELENEFLDYWTARADKETVIIEHDQNSFAMVYRNGDFFGYIGGDHVPQYAPAYDWSQGGPIIEREGIFLTRTSCMTEWRAMAAGTREENNAIFHMGYGRTPLIAAMRAFVASKFGDEVPDIKETA